MIENTEKSIYLRCDDHAETVVFSRYDWRDDETDYEITIEDAHRYSRFPGILGRFHRAWKAFWDKPVCYTGVYCSGSERVKEFLNQCQALMEE